ncbi:MAG: hypothetical protein WBQ34_01395 [Candidatus Acidiferrales bacterium]
MKARANGNWTRVARFWALVLPAIAALVLLCAGPNWARATQAQVPAGATPVAKAAAPAPQKSASTQSSPKGMNSGITVHGHWVIEVKNPDGTVATRREFDNSLQPNGQLGIAALLAGNVTGGGLAIVLNGNSVQWIFNTNGAGLRTNTLPATSPCTLFPSSEPGPCLITSYNNGQQPFINALCNLPSNSYGCSFNLSVAAPVLSNYLPPPPPGLGYSTGVGVWELNGPATITLSGSITAVAPGTITDVETWGFACVTTTTAQACNSTLAAPDSALAAIFYTLTERNLDGVGADPGPVNITSAGQSIAATVTLSFGSSD